MMPVRVFIALAIAASAAAAGAEPMGACSLLAPDDLAELGVPADAVPTLETQQGGVQYCKYHAPGASAGEAVATVILSTWVPDRVLQVRAMLSHSRNESTPAQREARGEFLADGATCKVVTVSQVETSQCLGTTEQSVVGLSLTRRNVDNKVAPPALQLRVISRLLSRVGERGG
ncbi:MAG: hypothetical protein JSR53_12075 [Proteobacteria bacterium]|nr:hypothetical protein [Pseudomonadota bacterium]